MFMPLYQQITNTLQKERQGLAEELDYKAVEKDRVIKLRKSKAAVERVDKPTNISKARALGYKAKQGIIVVRSKVRKGSGMHKRPVRARRPKRMGVNKLTRKLSIQVIAEQRASKKYPNLEVLNSYFVADEGHSKWYEVILVDPSAKTIQADKDLNWICSNKQKARAERVKTSAGKKSRGLSKKGKGTEKTRPSIRARNRQAK